MEFKTEDTIAILDGGVWVKGRVLSTWNMTLTGHKWYTVKWEDELITSNVSEATLLNYQCITKCCK